MRRLRAPALIVGGGPVGLYASALLSSFGVPSILVERTSPSAKSRRHPRAHLINSRSMELLRELGVEGAVRAQTPPLDEWRHFRYCTSLLGPQIAAQDHTAGVEWADLRSAAVTEMAHLSQPKLEAILRREAEARAPAADGSLLTGYECVRFEQDATGVRAELRRVAADTDAGATAAASAADGGDAAEAVVVEAEHVLACDGAHSSIRRSLGLELRGPPPLQHFKSVHFLAPDLAPRLRALGREAMLHFCFNRGAIAVLVAHNIEEGEWVAQLPFFPGLQDGATLDRAACAQMIAACIGTDADGDGDGGGGGGYGAPAAVPFDVRSIGSWAMSAKVAQRLSLGRVHLLGDAAHQFPPAGAFGANTGLQDAHNLCWKIGAAHHGLATPALVGTYDAERRPVALANARLAVHNYHRGLRVAEALGLPSRLPHDMAAAASALKARLAPSPSSASASPLAPLAAAAANALGPALLDAGRSLLIDAAGHEAPHALGALRRSRAARVVDSGRALPLLFARHELGYAYPSPPTPEGAAEAAGVEEDPIAIEDERYVATTRPGHRLPHHWMEDDAPPPPPPPQQAEEEEPPPPPPRQVSSHDLLRASEGLRGEGVPRLTLLIDASGGRHWEEGAAALADRERASLRVVATRGPHATPPSPTAASDATAAVTADGVDRVVLDACGGWAQKREVAPCGALLVRPDGHVAWRCERFEASGGHATSGADAAAVLREALAGALP